MAQALAPLDGTVALLCAADGASVAAGERIAEIECMKMFFAVEAPRAGRVRFVVVLGEVVGRDQPVAVIE